MAKITMESVLAFINDNKNNTETLRTIRDLCKQHLKDDYAAAKEQREKERAESLAAWQAEQDAKPLMSEKWTDSKGKDWIMLHNSYKHRDAIAKEFPKAFYSRAKKCWMVSADYAKEVDKFILKANKEGKL